MEKITLVCTTNNEHPELLSKMMTTAIGFDEIIIHYNGNSVIRQGRNKEYVQTFSNPKPLSIPDAYNGLIKEFVCTEWVCCFCDDDYFYKEGLKLMLAEIQWHGGCSADVAHFKFHISGYMPPQDFRGRILKRITGRTEYDLCERQQITPKTFLRHNRLPAGSFFRKKVWEEIGGFQGDKCHDHDFWLRACKGGFNFKYFDYLVYNHVRRPNSAWVKQNA